MLPTIAYLFTQAPYGNAFSKEGLSALLGLANFHFKISLFFVEDGIFQLLPDQEAHRIGKASETASFRLLELYEITECYLCKESLLARGIAMDTPFEIPVKLRMRSELIVALQHHAHIFKV